MLLSEALPDGRGRIRHPPGAYRQTRKKYLAERGRGNMMLTPSASREAIVEIVEDLVPDATHFGFFNKDLTTVDGKKYVYPMVEFSSRMDITAKPMLNALKDVGLRFHTYAFKDNDLGGKGQFKHFLFIDEKFMG